LGTVAAWSVWAGSAARSPEVGGSGKSARQSDGLDAGPVEVLIVDVESAMAFEEADDSNPGN
jgi:hypothetical protein